MSTTHTFKKGGVHPPDTKSRTNHEAIKNAVLPSQFVVPLLQHLGKPAVQVVEPGDTVREGVLIGESDGYISANVHSPVPGVVSEIRSIYLPAGIETSAIVIDTEGEFDRLGKPGRSLDWKQYAREELLAKIAEMGVVGLGGATFPAHVKFNIPAGSKVRDFVVNGTECEPYLTADHRIMVEKADAVIQGIAIVAAILSPESVSIGIEENKPDAIEAMRAAAGRSGMKLSVIPLKLKYPQGDEKQLLKAITGREVPSGELPLAIGAVVSNVGTVNAVYEAVVLEKPLIERVVTVSGGAVAEPANLKTRFGTPFRSLIEECGGFIKEPAKIVAGGPMMGFSVYDLDTPVIKGTSGVLALTAGEVRGSRRTNCLSCGRCVKACPMGLNPTRLFKYIDHQLYDEAREIGLLDCKECGCCGYVCPAHIPLVQGMKLGKNLLRKKGN
jgi:Na+-translocating ferredoxin:NAD+ oxidoreductase subunit C